MEPVGTGVSSDAGTGTLRYSVQVYTELHNNQPVACLRDGSRLRSAPDWVVELVEAIESAHILAQLVAIWPACFLSYALTHYGPAVDVNLAQEVVIILSSTIVPQMSAPVALGAYLGMASTKNIPNFGWLALLSVIGCCIWLAFKYTKLLVGFGGRLGMAAFASNNLLQVCVLMPAGETAWSLYGFEGNPWRDLTWQISLVNVLGCFAGVVLAKLWWVSGFGLEDPVIASTSAALLANISIAPSGWQYADTLMGAVATGSLLGMGGPKLLPELWMFAVAGLIAGGITILLFPFFSGWSGKEGFTAFLAYSSVALARALFLCVLPPKTASPTLEKPGITSSSTDVVGSGDDDQL